MTKLEKVAGNHGSCPQCGEKMFCNESKDKNGNVKLQWQNVDGKSHYLPPVDGPNGKKIFSCRNSAQNVANTVQAIKTQKIKLEDINLPTEVVEKVMYVIRSAEQFNKLTEYVVYDELGQDANPAQVAYHTKIITNKLLNVPNLQEILDNMGDKIE